jgi:N-formylglutamate amidohydrolase
VTIYRYKKAECPVLVSIPHAGVQLPDTLTDQFTSAARLLPDTDWFIDRLYDFLNETPVGVLCAEYSRYVVDLNRGRNDAPLYENQLATGLFPERTFADEPIYAAGRELTAEMKQARIDRFWKPYHEHLARELERLRDRFGFAVLWDAHSIRSRVPRLFDGELPHLNLGTNDGRSCDPRLATGIMECLSDSNYTVVLNGRFKGGYITRNYGNPADRVHALQLEVAQRCYMHEADSSYAPAVADELRELLRRAFEIIAAFRFD